MDPFYIKQNDTQPSISATLTEDGVAVDITGATVTFVMRPRLCRHQVPAANPKVEAAATVVDAATGQVRYDWAAGDLDTEGLFDGEFKVTLAGAVTTYPSTGYIPINVVKDLS
jgi:hypothetical protein